MLLEEYVRTAIRTSRRSPPARLAARLAERYLNAWHNTGFFDFDRNGEAYLLRTFASTVGSRPVTVWDVGAHAGQYAAAIHARLPHAHVTSFEILPPIAVALRERNFDPAWFTLRAIGLSDAPGSVEVSWNRLHDQCNAITPRPGEWFDHGEVEQIVCEVSTIDLLIEQGAAPPNFLKIDVEGHDAAVLDGAQALLASDHAPKLIQFEYGDTWIPSGRTLFDVQTKLHRYGYAVGRLYPDHVGFKEYAFADERYRMGNMVATRDPELRTLLS